jgi:hypothetical protein
MILMYRWNRGNTSSNNVEKLFDMSVMNWSEFLEALQNPAEHGDRWQLFASMDCIIGGVDTDIHYL